MSPQVSPPIPTKDAVSEQVRVHLGEWRAGAGPTFEVVAIRPGVANGLEFPLDALRASVDAGLWEGAAVFLDHSPAAEGPRAGARSLGELAGVLERAWCDEAVRASLRCSGPKGPLVASLARELLADQAAGRPIPRVGLSADLSILRDGAGHVRQIRQVHSLDVVYNPAAGGAFVRALNAIGASPLPRPEAGPHLTTERITMEQEKRMTAETEEVGSEPGGSSIELARLQCEHALNTALRDAGLPAPLERTVRRQLDGRIFGPKELEGAILAQQTAWAELIEAGTIKGLGRARPVAGGIVEPLERLSLAWQRCLGLPIPECHSDIPRLSGIRELYLTLTGDDEFFGRPVPERALLANATSESMANVIADGLNKAMLAAYNVRETWWRDIVLHRDLERYQEMKMIRVHGFSSLSTVNEGSAYTEKTWGDVMETAAIAKKGNYIGLTLEMIMADDMDTVRAVPTLLASAAYNTASDMVSEVFTANAGAGPLMSDTYHLFDADEHGNLRTGELSLEELDAAATAMMDQTEPGSGRKLAIPPAYLLVPTTLRTKATILRNSIHVPGSGNNDINPWYSAFEVVVVPPWSDPYNWALAAPPAQSPGIVMGWLFGQQEPQIFVADSELAGSLFTHDEMRIKVRWFLCVGVADYRGLHKNNVA